MAAPSAVVQPRRWPRYLLIGAIGFLILAILAVGGGYLYLKWRFAQIHKTAIHGLVPDSGLLNVLLVGSDSRANVTGVEAQQTGKSQVTGQRSDTIMILHADTKQKKTAILSIPRDLYLPIAGTNGQQRINTAFDAGAQRLVDTIQQGLGIKINHYVQVDFVGFQSIVNAIGGVNMYVPSPARDKLSGLDVKTPGCVQLTGFQALAWARSRHYEYYEGGRWKVDPTGDIGRIARQQEFIRRMLRKALATRNPFRLNQLIGIGIKNVQVDDQMSSSDLFGLARKFHSLNADAVDMLTLPTNPLVVRLGGQAADVLKLKQPEAQGYIDRINGITVDQGPTGTPVAQPAEVRTRVLNGTGRPGLAGDVSVSLHAAGFNVVDKGDADAFKYTRTMIRYAPNELGKAELLQRYMVSGAKLQADSSLRTVDVAIVIGSDYAGVRAKPGPASAGEPAATTTTIGKTSPTSAAKGAAQNQPAC